ncbi:MAG: hypothetical protein HUU37_07470 [Bdellovibrionales bacterium]|nr:hypothetical protein [Bdellovibrionales bacterium]
MANDESKKAAGDEVTEDELDALIEDLAQSETLDAKKPEAKEEPAVAEVIPMKAPETAEQNLKLELRGSINLKLIFSSGERSIEVFCTEDALICRMADGTEFKIPTGIHSTRKRAA